MEGEEYMSSEERAKRMEDTSNGGAATTDSNAEEPTWKERKVSWPNLRHVDSLNLEAGNVSNAPYHNAQVDWRTTLALAFQSIGIIYGDIGTSPLYVFASTFPDGIPHNDDILGVLSLIFYTIILSPLIKYVFIVLQANDNGNGGTFALYSLICRHARISLIPNHQAEDRELSNYRLGIQSYQLRRVQKIKDMERSIVTKLVLLFLTILGVSLVIGDGIFTPCISVLSAVSGLKRSAESLNQDAIVGISVAILIILFSVQRFGTDKVGSSFAPIIFLWFSFISGIGIYNLFKHNVSVLRAFYPKFMIDYFARNGERAWVSLGGVVLCITGTEAMFADLGHFSVRSVQISFSGIVFPALISAYSGQAAYLTRYPDDVLDTFYKSTPDPLYWPTFIIAVCAAIIASQAMISGAFQIISQSLSLGCFPRVKVVHTSSKHEGQVYIPEINFIIMVACVIVTVSFQTTVKIGNAYGIAVVGAEAITTFMVSVVMLVIWKTSIWKIVLFYGVMGTMETLYLTSVLYKFTQGGYLPLVISLFATTIMGLWHYVHIKRYVFELKNKVPRDFIKDLAMNSDITRVPGMGLLYSELVQGLPPIFQHFISNIPSIHSVLVFVSIKFLPINKVAMEERFLFRQVEPRDYWMFRCVVRYGYNDATEGPNEFEINLVKHLKEFIRYESFILQGGPTKQVMVQQVDEESLKEHGSEVHTEESQDPSSTSHMSSGSIHPDGSINSSSQLISGGITIQGPEEEMQFIQKAMEKGVVYLLGQAEIVAKPNSSLLNKIAINYVYNFIKKNFRQGEKIMSIPQRRLLRVGMIYEI